MERINLKDKYKQEVKYVSREKGEYELETKEES